MAYYIYSLYDPLQASATYGSVLLNPHHKDHHHHHPEYKSNDRLRLNLLLRNSPLDQTPMPLGRHQEEGLHHHICLAHPMAARHACLWKPTEEHRRG